MGQIVSPQISYVEVPTSDVIIFENVIVKEVNKVK